MSVSEGVKGDQVDSLVSAEPKTSLTSGLVFGWIGGTTSYSQAMAVVGSHYDKSIL